MAAIVYDYATWIAGYPEFAGVSPAQGQAWFDRAGLYVSNDTAADPSFAMILPGQVPAPLLSSLLYLVTSHLAWLYAPRDARGFPVAVGLAPSPIVGRISSASEGSVSVSAELSSSGSPSEAFFTQTRYGLEFWQATAQFRTMRYVPQRTIIPNSIYPYRGRRFY